MLSSNPYLNVLKSLEADVYPVVAVELETRALDGTFRLGSHLPHPPRSIRVAQGLTALSIVGLVGVTTLLYVRRRSRIVLSNCTSNRRWFAPTTIFLVFTFLNSVYNLLYLSHLPDPHHTINLVSSSFPNLLVLAQALALTVCLAKELTRRIGAAAQLGQPDCPRWFRGARFTTISIIGSVLLLGGDIATSLATLVSSFALRDSFFKARINLLLLATSPSQVASASTTSILRVLAGPIEVIQRDLQGLRRSEIGKDAFQVASEVALLLACGALLSNVTSHIPRPAIGVLPRRIRFKRASSISKLPIVDEVVPVPMETSTDETSIETTEIRRNVFAIAALAVSIFLFALLSNLKLALDVLGRRWTAPVESFGPTRLWSIYLYSSISLATLVYLAYIQLGPSTTTFSLSSIVPLARIRREQGEESRSHEGYVVPAMATPPASPPISIASTTTSLEEENLEKLAESPAPALPVLLESYPFPPTTV
ncbi:uncharacterized protein JCM15063_006556 [Sporobolomyces koalae]|uniref:uncharacterized protein n=1 Tax=Sporobolomyces koalae TaxID=500713 RepID=UPI003171EA61